MVLRGEGYQDNNYLRQCLSCGRYFGWVYYVDQEGMERCLDWEDVKVPDWFTDETEEVCGPDTLV
jgi:hypothetical protein